MHLGIEGKAAVVGGGSSGIGLAIAEELASEGCRLLLWARNRERLQAAADEIQRSHGVEVHTLSADATDPDAARMIARAAKQELRSVDILVLNSGGPPAVDVTQTEPDAWRRALQLLAATPIELATRLLPGMRERGWGRIVAVLSSGIRQPIPNLVYSNAGRSALAAWLKTCASQVASDGVTINGVVPGRVATSRVRALDEAKANRLGSSIEEVERQSRASIPLGRYGRTEEFSAVVAFLCSSRASYQTGTFVPVDGGLVRGL